MTSRNVVLEDVNGDQIYPVTLSENVFTGKGVTLKETLENLSGGGSAVVIDKELSNTSTNPVQNKVISAKLDEVFQSVSSGKELLASALTDKGFDITSDATFEEMTECIRQLSRNMTSVTNNTFLTEEESVNNVFSSSWYGSFDRKAYKAFDNNTSTQWCCQPTTDMKGEYIGYNFGELINITSLSVVINNSNESNARYIVQGSKSTVFNNSAEWVNLTNEIDMSNVSGSTTNVHTIEGDASYAMYRLLFTAGEQTANRGTDIYEIKIDGYKYE